MTRTAAVLVFLVSASSAIAEEKGPPGTVTLPRRVYDGLLDRVAATAAAPPAAPVPAVLSRADLRLAVRGESVRGRLQLEGDVLQAGLARVPLVAEGTVLEVLQGGRPVPVLHETGGFQALVAGPGPFVLDVEWGMPVATDPRGASFVLPVPAAGSVKATLEIPEARGDVHLEPGVITGRSDAAGKTRLELALDSGRRTRVWWSSRQGPAAPREARFLSEVKTLVTVGEAELRMAALLEVSVLQGSPDRFQVVLPDGFEVTSVSGASLGSHEVSGRRLALLVDDAARPRHQFLVGLERATTDGSFQVEVALPGVEGAQRETGEIAVEGAGTLELSAPEKGALRRMDVSEAKPALQALSREPLLAAFRYHGTGGPPALPLEVRRFPGTSVLAAVAERAVVTTLVTGEGRALTEVALTVRNQGRPFLRLTLPQGVSVLSAEVAGQSVKPVLGDDGTRVPLLRPGFRPQGPYPVSFVFLRAGERFGKKGEAQVALPPMDLPVSLVSWELFLPEGYRVKRLGGDVLPGEAAIWDTEAPSGGVGGGVVGATLGGTFAGRLLDDLGPGQLGGLVQDSTRSAVPGATVTLEGPAFRQTVVSGVDGSFVFSGVPPGRYVLRSELTGFKTAQRTLTFSGQAPRRLAVEMKVGGLEEAVEVTAEARELDPGERRRAEDQAQLAAPSANVLNLQRRVAGVLPVRIDVPRVGTSYHVFRPLVLDEETTVRFAYKRR